MNNTTNRNNTIKWVIGIIIVVIIIWFGFLNKSNEPKSNEPIKIGVILPLSGQYAFFGEDEKDALDLALKNSNVKMIFEDDGFDATKAVSAYQKLISIDKVDILVNADSVAFAAIYPLIKKDKILTFQIFESSEKHKDTIFQIMPSSYALFSKLGEVSNNKYKTVALVYGGSEFLKRDADYFKKTMPKNKIVYELMSGPNSDYRTEVTKLLAKKPEATTLFLSLENGIKFLKALKNQVGERKISLICDSNIEISIAQYIKAVGENIFNGCLSTNLPNQMTESFKTKFKQVYGKDPVFSSDYAYDIGLIIDKLTQYPKIDWLKITEKIKFIGASGVVQFGKMGTRLPISEVHIFKNGKFIKLTK